MTLADLLTRLGLSGVNVRLDELSRPQAKRLDGGILTAEQMLALSNNRSEIIAALKAAEPSPLNRPAPWPRCVCGRQLAIGEHDVCGECSKANRS